MSKTALIIVDHGSVRAAANQLLDDVTARVKRAGNGRYVAVEPAHMELAEPSIGAAFDACVAAGADAVVVTLFFLSPGRHARDDIPRLVAEAAARHADVKWTVTEPLGLNERLAELLLASTADAEETLRRSG